MYKCTSYPNEMQQPIWAERVHYFGLLSSHSSLMSQKFTVKCEPWEKLKELIG